MTDRIKKKKAVGIEVHALCLGISRLVPGNTWKPVQEPR